LQEIDELNIKFKESQSALGLKNSCLLVNNNKILESEKNICVRTSVVSKYRNFQNTKNSNDKFSISFSFPGFGDVGVSSCFAF